MAERQAKPVRLNKVAKETNVGVSTLVDFLQGKGIEIESSPNTKVAPDHYELILEEFKPDLLTKQRSQEEQIARQPKETVAIDYMAQKAAPKAEEKAPEEPKAEEETPAPKVEEVKAPEPKEEAVAEAPKEEEKPAITEETPVEEKEEEPKKKAAETPAKEPEPVKEEIPEPVKEEVKEPVAEKPAETEETPATAEEKKEEPKKEEDGPVSSDSKLNVVGKIDLGTLNQKTRPTKKTRKEIAEEKEARKKVEDKIRKDQAAQKEADEKTRKATEASAKEEKAAPAKKEEEFLKTNFTKLSGPTVVGKIELPADRKPKKKDPKKPVASSTDADNKKRKRKRITKVDPSKPGQRGGGPGQRGPGGPRGKKREAKPEVREEDIQKEIKETLARLSGGGKSKGAKNRRAKRDAVSQKMEEQRQQDELGKSIIKVTEFVTVAELAVLMDVSPTEVISACMSLGVFAAINQRLDAETLVLIAEEFGFELEFVTAEDSEVVLEQEDNEEALTSRPPVVTVMGHVDHGKTSLLDYYRKTNVIGGEAGGITQHIGAYSVNVTDDKKITFLDTPGHEAFTAMRARGAQATDIAIIVISADDSVMPQTKEAINHAQAANVPMIFAFNKIDKPGANSDKIREELSQMNILVEDWGGKFQCQEISAKKGTNMDQLLEKVLLEAELLELKADPTKRAVGTTIESSLDKGRGYVTTLLVQGGTLRVGDVMLAGSYTGKVKAMHNEWGKPIQEAGPARPVSILGINGAVGAGDTFYVMEDEKEARGIANKRLQLAREQGIRTQKHITLDEIGRRLALGDFKELNIVLKGDVDGSIQALSDSLLKLSTDSIQVNIIHKGVGPITESDVLLASASDAIVVGFQVRPVATARKLAEKEEIEIRHYSIIYDAIDEVRDAMEGMLSPEIKEEIKGTAEIRETFKITKVGTIAGCIVTSGKIERKNKVRLIREGVVVYTGELGSLKRFKDDVKEVGKGYECGLNIANYNDIKEADVIEAYEEVEVKATLKKK